MRRDAVSCGGIAQYEREGVMGTSSQECRDCSSGNGGGGNLPFYLACGLVLLIFVVYESVFGAAFITLDDPAYIYNNDLVRQGLTRDGLLWAFSTLETGNWLPLTWLSHMAIVELLGLNPFWQHTANIVLHAASCVLLFAILYRLTGAAFRSFVVAALLAVHPLHVESVAWISERKDVLSMLFALLSVYAYALYAQAADRDRRRWMLASLLFFVLGLMSKAMLVSLPLLLLLLDYWPLRRFGSGTSGRWAAVWTLVKEKCLFFAASGVFCSVAYYAQAHSDSVSSLERVGAGYRMANVLVSYVAYLYKLVAPFDLGVLYPLRPVIPKWHVLLAGLLLLAITAGVVKLAARNRFLAMGWFWYLIAMLPVIGIVQIGGQSMADRYAYIPFIGLYIAIVWGVCALASRFRFIRNRAVGYAVMAVVIAYFGVTAHAQAALWKNSETLFGHTLSITGPNPYANKALGQYYWSIGERKKAFANMQVYYDRVPDSVDSHVIFAEMLVGAQRYAEAIRLAQDSLQRFPDSVRLYKLLGISLYATGKKDEALQAFLRAREVDPDDKDVAKNIGILLRGKTSNATE